MIDPLERPIAKPEAPAGDRKSRLWSAARAFYAHAARIDRKKKARLKRAFRENFSR